MDFCDIIQNFLNEKNINSKELSKSCGIPYTTIRGWFYDKKLPSYNQLLILAKYFNCSADYLLGLEDDFGVKSYDSPTVSALTDDEKELLELYKQLPPERKKMLIYSAQDSLTAWRSKFGAGNVSRK